MENIIDKLDKTLMSIAALIKNSRVHCDERCLNLIDNARDIVNRIRRYVRYTVISPATAISMAILTYRIGELAKALEHTDKAADAHNLVEVIFAYLERIAKFVSVDYRKARLQLSMPITLLAALLFYKSLAGGGLAEVLLSLGIALSALLFVRSPPIGLAMSTLLAAAYAALQLIVYGGDLVEALVSWLLAIANLVYLSMTLFLVRKGYARRVEELADKIYRSLYGTSRDSHLLDLSGLDEMSRYRLAILLMNGLNPEDALKLLNIECPSRKEQFK